VTNVQVPSISTVGEWFDSLEPPPPPQLARVLRDALSNSFDRTFADAPEVCLRAAEEMLAALLQSGSTERATALTLLSVDALVTYSFEAASHQPERFEERAADAMRRISLLAEGRE
jgi:hypothetical protein